MGWHRAVDSEYGSLLYYTHRNYLDSIPILSNRAVQNFKISGFTQSLTSALVYGKIMPGWDIEFRSEDLGSGGVILYFDQDGHAVTQPDATQNRFFIALNVLPGYRFLKLRSLRGEGEGSVAVPALSDTKTYVDLTHISAEGTVSGTLYDEDPDEKGQVWPLGGSVVRILGQPHARMTTDLEGKFQFVKNVVVTGYPFFLESNKEVESPDGRVTYPGFVHRYEVNFEQNLEGLKLFRVPNKKITENWLAQLDGLSAETGLVVAVGGEAIEQFSDRVLFPTIRSLSSTSKLVPKAYTLSAGGQLLKTSLHPGQDQFIGVEVEGPTLVGVEDAERVLVWGRLTYASPRVVTVVTQSNLPF